MQDNQFRRFLAFGRTAARIRTRSFRPNEAALVVVRQGTRAMGVPHKNGKLVVLIEHADRAWLFLRKQQTAVFRADDAVRIIGSLPDEFPFGASRDDPGDSGNLHFLCSSRLWKGISLLCGGERAETKGDREPDLELHRISTCRLRDASSEAQLTPDLHAPRL